MCKLLAAVALTTSASLAAGGQDTVDVRRQAARDGRVDIDVAAGSVRVIGWDKDVVAVTGSLGRGAENLDFDVQGSRTSISVETQGNPHGVRSDLEIRVPAASRVQIESFSAQVSASGLKGDLEAESVQGSISVDGEMKTVKVENVGGALEVTGSSRWVHAESVNGSVVVRGVSEEVEASTVNGHLRVEAGAIRRGELGTVNGTLEFVGDLAPGGQLDVETVSGEIDLAFPAGVSAEFQVTTFSGAIDNEFGGTPERVSRYTTEKQLDFTAGGGGAEVDVQTMSGSVRLRKR
jgi:Toastrack DUF4097